MDPLKPGLSYVIPPLQESVLELYILNMTQRGLEIKFWLMAATLKLRPTASKNPFLPAEQGSAFQLTLVFFLISINQHVSNGKANTGNSFLMLLSC